MDLGSDRLRLKDNAGAATQAAADRPPVTAALRSNDNSTVASSVDMSRRLEHTHQVRL
jgi:hypothetical protein